MPREALSFGLQPGSVPTVTFSAIVGVTLGVRPRRAPRAVPDPRPAPARSPAPLRPPRGRRTGRWSAVAPGALERRPERRCSEQRRADPALEPGSRPLRCTGAGPRSRMPRFLLRRDMQSRFLVPGRGRKQSHPSLFLALVRTESSVASVLPQRQREHIPSLRPTAFARYEGRYLDAGD